MVLFAKMDDQPRDQESHLPISNIARIMKRGLPPQGKIAKEAKETIQDCVTEFICFIASEVHHLPCLLFFSFLFFPFLM